MCKIAIIGAGDLGRQIAHMAQNSNSNNEIVGFFDDYANKNSVIDGIRVLGEINDIDSFATFFDSLIIGIGYKHFLFRERLFNAISKRYNFTTLIDKTAIIDSSATIEDGSVIMPGVVIGENVVIKKNVFINLSTTIAHDSIVGSHSFIAPSVAIAGNVRIGERNFIGINSTIIDGLSLSSDCKFGGGTVVIKNIEKSGLYVGNPARFVRS